MQINRLLEIVYILLSKKTVTAKELSEYFEVSQRTIYRDIDALSCAGIPIYTNKGKGGGISLIDSFVLNKSLLTEKEQIDILSSLHGLNALNVAEVEPVLKRLSLIFDKKNTNWIDVDFSSWDNKSDERAKFNLLKMSILNRCVVNFSYFSSYGEKTERAIEPLKLLFKGQGWYVYGYCRTKKDFRIFKLTRIKELNSTNEIFERDVPETIVDKTELKNNKTITLVLKVDTSMAFMLYDVFDNECIVKNLDGSFTVTTTVPEGEWIYGYILSFGCMAEVLEPKSVRDIIKNKFEEGLKIYS